MKKLLILLCIFVSSITFAKDTLKIYIPQPPGGLNDVFVRQVQQRINSTPELNLNAVVINKPGAEGMVVLNELITDKSSEYTLLFTGLGLFYKSAEDSVNYVNARSLIPVIHTLTTSTVFVVEKDSKFKSWNDVLKYNTTNLNIGTSSMLAGKTAKEVLPAATLVPFNGDVPVLLNLKNKTLDIGVVNHFTALPLYQSKDIRILVDTYSGGKDYTKLNSNYGNSPLGFYAPAGTSLDKVKYLNKLIAGIMKDPEIVSYYTSKGLIVNKNFSQEQFANRMETLTKR